MRHTARTVVGAGSFQCVGRAARERGQLDSVSYDVAIRVSGQRPDQGMKAPSLRTDAIMREVRMRLPCGWRSEPIALLACVGLGLGTVGAYFVGHGNRCREAYFARGTS
jgi:hypothetical protein